MADLDFWKFVTEGKLDEKFPEGYKGEFRCSYCGCIITPEEEVEYVNKETKKFICPDCGEELNITPTE